jgi:hypothetical protein
VITDYLHSYAAGINSDRVYDVGRIYACTGERVSNYKGINDHHLRAIDRIFLARFFVMPLRRAAREEE